MNFHRHAQLINIFLILITLLSISTACQYSLPNSESENASSLQLPATQTALPQFTAAPRVDCAELKADSDEHGLIPKPIVSSSLAYDSVRQKTILYDPKASCTWEYDGENWELIETTFSPPSNMGSQLVYDSVQGVTLLINDCPREGEVWQYDGENWQALPVEGSFRSISSCSLAATYIPQKQVTYVLGTCWEHCSEEGHYSGWLFDGHKWTEERIIPFGARPGEPTFMDPEIVYDENSETLILLTGFGGTTVGSWALHYDGTEWQVIVDNSSGSGLNDLSLFFDMAYDSSRKVIVLFGAFPHEEGWSAETWEYDGISWKQMSPIASPSMRIAHALAYDQARSAVVLFGGYNPDDSNLTDGKFTYFYETWEYDGITWRQR